MRLWLLAGLLLTIAGGAGLWFSWQHMQLNLGRSVGLEAPELVEIPAGASLRTIATDLAARGWLEHALYLRLEMALNYPDKTLQAGFYELLPGESLRALLEKSIKGQIKQYAVTLPEGITVDALRQTLATLPGLRMSLQQVPTTALMGALGLGERAAEGRFFPSTYFYKHHTTDRELLLRMNRQLEQILAQAWADRAQGLPYDNAEQALVMASIIERETAVPAERAQIAGVFVRRLQLGMKLQTDPTVIYGLGDAFDGNLRRADLERDTPYNTYTRAGLPPTPISLPGKEAILAALNPAPGETLYFVARGDGTHVFSRTLAEHNAAVRDYQLSKRQP